MPWSDYIPFLGGGDPKAEDAKARRIRYIVEDIRNRHELQGDDRPLAQIGQELEAVYGDREAGVGGEQATPGWRNAEQYRRATENVDDNLRQGYMSPERYEYMQNAGRDIDFLSNVEADPDTALKYWDRSNNARSTRGSEGWGFSLWHPNYQRYSSWGHGAMATVADRRSLIAKYLQNMSIASNILQDWAGGTPIADAAMNANALNQLQQRANVGENPVGTLPDATPGASIDQLSREWQDNQSELTSLYDRVSPRSGQYVANRAAGTPLPRIVGDATSTVTSMADPTFALGLRHALTAPAAGVKAAPRGAMASAGRVAGAIGRVAGAIGREAKQEAQFAGLLGLLLAPWSSHTPEAWGDYLLTPSEAPDTATEDERRQAADTVLSPAWQQTAPKIDRFGDFLR